MWARASLLPKYAPTHEREAFRCPWRAAGPLDCFGRDPSKRSRVPNASGPTREESKLKLRTLATIGGCALALTACGGPESGTGEADTLEILQNLVEAGFPESDILVTSDGLVYVGRDALVTLEASREMLIRDESRFEEFEDGLRLEQYQTRNLVSRNLDAICVDGSRFSGTLSTALNWAIANYNRLDLTFQMFRTNGFVSGCDALITAFPVGGSGGSAGFPSGGQPFGAINIGTGTAQFGTNTVEHVITHELGHTLGFRHSDYFNRSISCGTGGNEGGGGVGAIHIPGTPTGATVGGSIMNSCFRSNEDGEFTSSDRTALRRLY